MADQQKLSEPKKGTRFFGKILFLIVLIIVFTMYFLLDNIQIGNQDTNSNYSSSDHINQQDDGQLIGKGAITKLQDESTIDTKQSTYLVPGDVVEQGDTMLSPAVTDQEIRNGEVQEIEIPDQGENEAANLIKACYNNVEIREQLYNYRIFLKNANKLISKYQDNKNYMVELELFKEHIHPAHINKMIEFLELYHYQLVENHKKQQQRFDNLSWKMKLMNKFVKIKNVSLDSGELLNLKDNIDRRMHMLKTYIYSSNLQDSLISL